MMPRKVDFLVIGSGIAGLTFATKIPRPAEILILTKKRKADTNTNYAQGGIASVSSDDDSFDSHIQDTLNAGVGICHKDAVEIMVSNGPPLVQELYDMGCRFSVDAQGKFLLGREGGHSERRIVHAKDYTGYEIERVLLERAKQRGVVISENEIALDLVVANNECCGVYYYDADTRRIDILYANATALATGGAGQVYLHTTNPPIATGDGIAMAFRAGALIANMEFIQFHPTAVFTIQVDGRSFLISEAVRGEGGILKTTEGEPFMEKYSTAGNLAPRDIVARACVAEMNRVGATHVLLDISHLPADFLRNRFPTIYDTCLRWGIDITREPIPVVPAAHYTCGGIQVNTQGETSIKRLYALGESACTGVHGSNRLASNSLLEALVFANRAAQHAGDVARLTIPKDMPINATPDKCPDRKLMIKEIMSQFVGVIRNKQGLIAARDKVRRLYAEIAEGIHYKNAESLNMTHVALMIIESALRRQESRGLHYMEDYPDTDPEHAHDTVIDRTSILA
jgi:L-aspartate oxidase